MLAFTPKTAARSRAGDRARGSGDGDEHVDETAEVEPIPTSAAEAAVLDIEQTVHLQRDVCTLVCFAKLSGHDMTDFTDHTEDLETVVSRLQVTEVLALIRERTEIHTALLEGYPACD